MIFAVISCGLLAQQEKPLHYYQVGIQFSSLNSFGLNFKTGNEKTLFRLSLLTMNLGLNSNNMGSSDSVVNKASSYGAGIRLGFEKHVPVLARFNFIWGLEAGCNFSYQKQKRNTNTDDIVNENSGWGLSPLVNVILGVTYTIADHLVLGAEITPGIQYSYMESKTTTYNRTIEQTNSAFGFGFNNNSASLSVAYRFGK